MAKASVMSAAFSLAMDTTGLPTTKLPSMLFQNIPGHMSESNE
jgi:hypothetical protein